MPTEYRGLPLRGVHFDLKAHTMRPSMMMETARDMARLGYNTILLEYQDKFPFSGALADIASPDAMTPGEVAAFDALCRELGLRVIPLVQCLGHMHFVLRRPRFSSLGETNDVLCPSDARSFSLFCEMARQIMALHPSCDYVHIGGDECRLSPDCPRCGDAPKAALLAPYYEKCADFILSHGKKPMLWGDMLLAHPETLDRVRGKAVVMDWDYWTTGRPGCRSIVWGCDAADPESWSDLHKRLIRPYIFSCEPYLRRPFPYLRFLRDQGFEVIAAPAVRCAGDSHFAPMSLHADNCREAVRRAASANALGVIVTSWAARRGPWALTENGLVSAAALMKNPGLSDEEADAAYAQDSFGVADPALGHMPAILADAAAKAAAVCDLCVVGILHPNEDIGEVEPYEVRQRVRGQVWRGNDAIAPAYAALAEAAGEAEALLSRARPADERQRYRVELWRWSIGTARVMADYAPLLALDAIPRDAAASLLARFEALRETGDRLIAPRYTAESMKNDDYFRYGMHMEHLQKFL